MATIYFDPDMPVLDPTSADAPADVPQQVRCLMCMTSVGNYAVERTAHGAWHDAVAPTSAAAFGLAAAPAMSLTGTPPDIVVQLSREMPTATYAANADIISTSASALSSTRVMGIVGRTKSTVTVRVQNTGLAALAAGAFVVSVTARGPLS